MDLRSSANWEIEGDSAARRALRPARVLGNSEGVVEGVWAEDEKGLEILVVDVFAADFRVRTKVVNR